MELKVVIYDDYYSLMGFFLDLKGKMSDINSWRDEHDSESQSASVKSADSIPDVQDPLGSSVMTPNGH